MESSIDGTPVDCAHNLFTWWWPLAPPCALGLIEALKVNTNTLTSCSSKWWDTFCYISALQDVSTLWDILATLVTTYFTFDTKKFCTLSTECIYWFCMIFRIIKNCFSKPKIFVKDTMLVFYEVGTYSLNIYYMKFMLQMAKTCLFSLKHFWNVYNMSNKICWLHV